MTVNQIYQLLNDTANQCYGSNAVATLDLENMLALRDTVFGSDTEQFLNVLVDRIGKTVIRTLDFTSTFPNFIMSDFEFGAVLQKLSVAPFSAVQADNWEIGQGGFNANLYKIDKPTVYQDFFKTANTWEIDVTIPDVMFKQAFISAENMDAFITAIFDTISTSLNIQLENETRIAILGFIGEKINASNGVVDLLALYNLTASTPITSKDSAMVSKDFLRFSGKTMRNYISYMRKPSVLYNIPGRVRATSRDNMHCMILTEFASACETYLDSDTFHDDLVKLPYYTEVEYWQGTGATAPNFDDCSSIDIEIPSDGTKVTTNGIVGVFCDREAIGTGLFDRFSAVDRANRFRMSNYTEGVTIQTFVDTSENGVVFVVQDQTP